MRRFFAADVYLKQSDIVVQVAIEAESAEVARTKAEERYPVTRRGVASRLLGRINKIVEIGQGQYDLMNRFATTCAQGGE